MSVKVKIFLANQNNFYQLEEQVNIWLSENSNFTIKDIKSNLSDNNILFTIIYQVYSNENNELPIINNTQIKTNSFSSALESLAKEIKNENTSVHNIEKVNPNKIKPGKLIQNNYSKYTKNNQKFSEDQAFNWD
ncbi:MAG: hypothetical protein KatS3mg068_0264 [Candidatus Sericytochromatia bacterium]|nr:MAG: hypothetical protein KatS3mg068_0264 [Candidatus Sericytochromatia bacterium]